jgi:hypothetical protein
VSQALDKVTEFGRGSVDAFAAVEDATGAAGVEFDKQLPTVVDFANRAATSFGLSKRAALEAQNTFGTLGKAAGLAGPDLSGFSQRLTGLAGDMASFKGTSTEQAIEAVGAALRGESEPIRAYGVLLDDATLRNEALAMGLIKTTKEALTPQQKALAAQSAILKQTKDAQGDYARTASSTANVQKTLAAETENAQAALGQKLAPALTVVRQGLLVAIRGSTGLIDAFGAVTDKVTPIVSALVEGIAPAATTVADGFQSIAGAIPLPLLQGLGIAFGAMAAAMTAQVLATTAYNAITGGAAIVTGLFATTTNAETGATERGVVARLAHNIAVIASAVAHGVATAATTAWTAAQWLLNAALEANPIGLIVVAVAALVGGIILAYEKVGWFHDAVNAAFDGIKTAVSAVLDFFTTTVPAAFNTTLNAITTAMNAVVGAVQKAWDAVKSAFSAAISFVVLFVKSHWELLLGIIAGPIGLAVAEIIKHWDGIKSAFVNGVGAVVGFLTGFPAKILGALGDLGARLGRWAREGFVQLGVAERDGIATALGWFTSLPGKILHELGDLGSLLLGVGGDIVDGLARGIRAGVGDIGDALMSLIPGPLKKFAGRLGISSPSRVFAEYGLNIGQGLAVGIDRGAPLVTAAAVSLADAADLTGLYAGPPSFVLDPLRQNAPTPGAAPSHDRSGTEALEQLVEQLLEEIRGLRGDTVANQDAYKRETDQRLVLTRSGAML